MKVNFIVFSPINHWNYNWLWFIHFVVLNKSNVCNVRRIFKKKLKKKFKKKTYFIHPKSNTLFFHRILIFLSIFEPIFFAFYIIWSTFFFLFLSSDLPFFFSLWVNFKPKTKYIITLFFLVTSVNESFSIFFFLLKLYKKMKILLQIQNFFSFKNIFILKIFWCSSLQKIIFQKQKMTRTI